MVSSAIRKVRRLCRLGVCNRDGRIGWTLKSQRRHLLVLKESRLLEMILIN